MARYNNIARNARIIELRKQGLWSRRPALRPTKSSP